MLFCFFKTTLPTLLWMFGFEMRVNWVTMVGNLRWLSSEWSVMSSMRMVALRDFANCFLGTFFNSLSMWRACSFICRFCSAIRVRVEKFGRGTECEV